ncbi:MAG: kinase/pyrophosphorylase, partial [Pseudomonadota bacterium]
MARTVLFISDGTAITAETFGHSLLTQFSGTEFRQIRLPFVDTEEKARDAVELINRATEADAAPALVFNTIVEHEVGAVLKDSQGIVFDLFGTFLPPLEDILGTRSSSSVGQAHGIRNSHDYEDRMEATNYALTHDDGISKRMDEADVILVG